MSEPTPMAKRPPIRSVCYIDTEGNPRELTVGRNGITQIRETEENGEYSTIPWLEIWVGSELFSRFNQHKVERIFYEK